MLLDQLRDYYGMPDQEQSEFITKRTQGMSEADQNDVYQKIIESRSKRFGFPDIAYLSKYLTQTPKKARVYYWAVCLECGTEYAGTMPMCPKCYDKGLECRAKNFKTSETPMPMKVIRYNKEYTYRQDNELLCYVCAEREMSYCPNFGRPDYFCKEYRECKCNRCCMIAKKANEQMKQKQFKISYAKPRQI